MDNNDLKERDFEAYIEHWLLMEGGYTKGDQSTYDKERAIDLKTLVRFLSLTQTKKWELYEKKYGVQTEDRLYDHWIRTEAFFFKVKRESFFVFIKIDHGQKQRDPLAQDGGESRTESTQMEDRDQ